MNRLQPVDPNTAQGKARTLLDAVKQSFGVVPNLFRVTAQSPAALEGMLGLFAAVGSGNMDAQTRERLAIRTSEHNGCEYCLSAHTALGRQAGLSQSELDGAHVGDSFDPKARAALQLAGRILETRGHVGNGDIAAAKAAGMTDGDFVEVVANVALTVFTNFLGNVAETQIDFPVVKPRAARAA